jgi:hypothetical protein
VIGPILNNYSATQKTNPFPESTDSISSAAQATRERIQPAKEQEEFVIEFIGRDKEVVKTDVFRLAFQGCRSALTDRAMPSLTVGQGPWFLRACNKTPTGTRRGSGADGLAVMLRVAALARLRAGLCCKNSVNESDRLQYIP